MDIHGSPIDRYGRPIVYQNYANPPIYDPYGLGGVPKNAYPYQTMHGKSNPSQGLPPAAQGAQQNYY